MSDCVGLQKYTNYKIKSYNEAIAIYNLVACKISLVSQSMPQSFIHGLRRSLIHPTVFHSWASFILTVYL